MVKFEFYLSHDDFRRLYAIKREQGKADWMGDDFARDMLEKMIYRLHPEKVIDKDDYCVDENYDEDDYSNYDSYYDEE